MIRQKVFLILTLLIFIIYGCNGGSGSSSNNDVDNGKIIKSFTTEPTVVLKNVDTEVTIDYELNKISGITCYIQYNDFNKQVNSGDSIILNISKSTNIILTCIDKDENYEIKNSLINVAVKPKIEAFKSYPAIVNIFDEYPITLKWQLNNDVFPKPECSINNVNLDIEALNYKDNATAGDTFELICSNIAGSDSKQIQISGGMPLMASPPQKVTSKGGTFKFGNITLIIPENAVDKDTFINVEHVVDNFEDNALISPFKIYPDNLTFNNPITVKIQYNIDDINSAGHNTSDLDFSISSKNIDGNIYNLPATNETADTQNQLSFMISKAGTYSAREQKVIPPLKKDIMSILRRDEMVFFSPPSKIVYVDDEQSSYQTKSYDYNNYDVGYKMVTVGDFNLDGKDEIAMLQIYNYNDANLYRTYVSDYSKNAWRLLIYSMENGNLELIGNFTQNMHHYMSGDLTAADVDGDGKKEIIVAVDYRENTSYCNDCSKVDICIYRFGNPIVGAPPFYLEYQGTLHSIRNPRLSSADTNNDGIDEIYMMYKKLFITDVGTVALTKLGRCYVKGIDLNIDEIFHKSSEILQNNQYIDIAKGNFDDDSDDELVLLAYDYNHINVVVLDDGLNNVKYNANLNFDGDMNTSIAYNTNDGAVSRKSLNAIKPAALFMPMTTGDFNFDNIDEIVIIVSNNLNNYALSPMVISINNKDLPIRKRFPDTYTLLAEPFTEFLMFMDTGDINSDGKDELIAITQHYNYGKNNTFYAMSASYYPETDKSYYAFKSLLTEPTGRSTYIGSNIYDSCPAVAVGDFDKDNIKLRYTGKHQINTLNPTIIAAIAAPPTWDNETMQEDLKKSETSYGTVVSSGKSSTHEIGFSCTLSIGVKTETPVWNFTEGSVKFNWTEKYMSSDTTKKITSYGTSYSIDYGHNGIIFTNPIYDAYLYEVLSHPDIENITKSDDGKRYITINIPQQALIYKWDEEYFLSHSNVKLDENLFTHEIGNPFSYPNDSDMKNILSSNADVCDNDSDGFCSFESPNYTPVGEGASKSTTKISFEYENIKENKTVSEVSVDDEVCVSEVCGGVELAYENSNIYEISAGKEMEFEGTVADINEKYYEDYLYSFKLFVYFNKDNTNGQKYLVVNYAVEH